MKIFLLLMLYLCPNISHASVCKKTVEGYLQLFGTDHFPQVAVVTDENERFFLDLPQEKLDSLWSERKNLIRITGKIYEGDWSGKPHAYIKPETWEWIDKPDH